MSGPLTPTRLSLKPVSGFSLESTPIDTTTAEDVRRRTLLVHAALQKSVLEVTTTVSLPQPQPQPSPQQPTAKTTPATGALSPSDQPMQTETSEAAHSGPSLSSSSSSSSSSTSSSSVSFAIPPAAATEPNSQAAVLTKPITDDTFSDPCNMIRLPYPASYVQNPSNRLRLEPSDTEAMEWMDFMGREGLRDVLQAIDRLIIRTHAPVGTGVLSLADARRPPVIPIESTSTTPKATTPPRKKSKSQPRTRHSQLLVYGTPGWGKTYLVAAIVVLLTAQRLAPSDDTATSPPRAPASNLRVVFIPKCSQLVSRPLRTMQEALIAAFADDKDACNTIVQATDPVKLVAFCKSRKPGSLLFLLDEYNEIYAYDRSSVDARDRDVTLFLEECSERQFRVQIASINDSNKDDIVKKQMNVDLQPFFGGLTKVRTKHRTVVASVCACRVPLTGLSCGAARRPSRSIGCCTCSLYCLPLEMTLR